MNFKDKIVASIVPLACAGFMFYMGYQGLYGNRGLVNLFELNEDIERLEYQLAKKEQERDLLEIRTRLLRPESLDLDLLEERSRAMLGYAHAQDVVIFDSKE